jgi:hypothetical protein
MPFAWNKIINKKSLNMIRPSHDKIVIFCYAGRQKFLDIQIKFILKILEKNINVEYHLWNQH